MLTCVRIFILAFGIFFCAVAAYAGSGSGKVLQLMAHSSNAIMFKLETHTGAPACSSDEWALSLSTEAGKAQYALLLSAAAQGQTVYVTGTNTCTAWSDRETPAYIFVKYQ